MKKMSINIAGNGLYTLVKKNISQKEADLFVERLLGYTFNHPDLEIEVGQIISGGQTGFDEAGIKAGSKLGYLTAVVSPSEWRMRGSNGKDIVNEDAFKNRFKGCNTIFLQHDTSGYAARTAICAKSADVTIAFAVDFNTAGEVLTKKLAAGRYIAIDANNMAITEERILTLVQRLNKYKR